MKYIINKTLNEIKDYKNKLSKILKEIFKSLRKYILNLKCEIT